MINKLTLTNFKLFKEETQIPLSKINLLTGVNGRGKSSVLQPFMLFMQSPAHERNTDKIHFNGINVNLGFFEDVKNIEVSPKEQMYIRYEFASDLLKYSLEYHLSKFDNDPSVAKIDKIFVSGTSEDEKFEYEIFNEPNLISIHNILKNSRSSFPVFFDLFIPEDYDKTLYKILYENLSFLRVHYVSADRIGPKLHYQYTSPRQFATTGPLGENAVSILHQNREANVDSRFLENIGAFYSIPLDEIDKTISGQVDFWLDKIFLGSKHQINAIPNTNLLTFEISTDRTSTYYRATNVGYGFSYVLPIIASGLIAKEGEILIIENPEAHLHPYAQSVISKFLTLVSLKGVQVIVESHSEHILNGFRISVFEKTIDKNDLNVLYFDNSNDKKFKVIEMDDDAVITNWPSDFFDQSTKDLNHLLGI